MRRGKLRAHFSPACAWPEIRARPWFDSPFSRAIPTPKDGLMIANSSSAAAAAPRPEHAAAVAPIARAVHDRMANAIRALAMDAVEQAKSGHPGLPMGAADIATVLFTRFLKFDPADPAWPDRDRFVLSAGHGSMLIYAAAPSARLRETMTLERDQALPPDRLEHAGPSGKFHHAGRRDHHRPARPGAWPMRSAWRWRSGTLPPNSA